MPEFCGQIDELENPEPSSLLCEAGNVKMRKLAWLVEPVGAACGPRKDALAGSTRSKRFSCFSCPGSSHFRSRQAADGKLTTARGGGNENRAQASPG